MTTSGSAFATASPPAAPSRTPSPPGPAPASDSLPVLAGLRVVPVTWCPAASSCGTSCLPTAPVAPTSSTCIEVSLHCHPLRRDRVSSCDRAPAVTVVIGGPHGVPRSPQWGERLRSVLERHHRRAEHQRQLRHADFQDLAVVRHAAGVQRLLVDEVLGRRRVF